MRQQPALSTILIVLLFGGGAFAAWHYWHTDDRPARVEKLQTTLIAQSFDQDVSDWKRQRTTEALMREVDQLDEPQRKVAWESVRKEYRDWQLVAARAWQELPPDEQPAFLDSKLNEGQKWRQVFFAMHAEVPHVPQRFRKSYVESEEGKQALAASQQQQDRAKDAAGGKTSKRVGDARANRQRGPRGRRHDGRWGRAEKVDENDPDAVLLSEYRRAMIDRMRAKWSQRQARSGSQQPQSRRRNQNTTRGVLNNRSDQGA